MKASWNARSYKAVTRSPTDGELFQIESHVVAAARVTHPSKSRGDDDCRRDTTPRYLDVVVAAAADFFPRSFVGGSAGWLAGWSSYLSTTNPPRQRKEGRNESTKSAQFRHRSTPICQRAEQANASVAATQSWAGRPRIEFFVGIDRKSLLEYRLCTKVLAYFKGIIFINMQI